MNQNQDSPQYIAAQLEKLNPIYWDGSFRLQIKGNDDQTTTWIIISKEQFEAIRGVLTT